MEEKSKRVKYDEDLISEELFGLVEKYSFDKAKLGELRHKNNLTGKQFHEVLKTRFRMVYESYPNQIGPSSRLRETAKRYYRGWCEDFGIIADLKFPDW